MVGISVLGAAHCGFVDIAGWHQSMMVTSEPVVGFAGNIFGSVEDCVFLPNLAPAGIGQLPLFDRHVSESQQGRPQPWTIDELSGWLRVGASDRCAAMGMAAAKPSTSPRPRRYRKSQQKRSTRSPTYERSAGFCDRHPLNVQRPRPARSPS